VNAFDDVLSANEKFASAFTDPGLPGSAAHGLAVLTCVDSHIDPLAMLGLTKGDGKILRNAGARVTDDVLRTLVLAVYLLGVNRILVVARTDCGMSRKTQRSQSLPVSASTQSSANRGSTSAGPVVGRGAVTPEQARFARAGAAIVAAQVRGYAVGRDLLIERVVADRGLARLAGAFAYAAVAAVARAAGGRGVTFESVLAGVPRRCGVVLVPSAVPWEVAVGLVSAAQAQRPVES
jgi:carbonic anhydrase